MITDEVKELYSIDNYYQTTMGIPVHRLITEVKHGWARLVPEWVTLWEFLVLWLL